MRFKNFEIRPTIFLDGHTDPKRYDVVLWKHADKPFETTNLETGEKHMMQDYCFSVASLIYDEHEEDWYLQSVGSRFLEYYEEGLNEYILRWMALASVCQQETDDKE